MRRCTRCGLEKPIEDFGIKKAGTTARMSYCRPCVRASSKAHYEANKSAYLDRNKRKRKQLQTDRFGFLIEYFKTHPCVDCGQTDPIVLDFDHLRDKEFTIGSDLIDRPWHEVLAEIEKCEVVCANCHRRRTARRAGYLRALLAAER